MTHIVTHADTQDLMLAYNLPAFLQGDAAGFLAGLARVSGLIKKVGVELGVLDMGCLWHDREACWIMQGRRELCCETGAREN